MEDRGTLGKVGKMNFFSYSLLVIHRDVSYPPNVSLMGGNMRNRFFGLDIPGFPIVRTSCSSVLTVSSDADPNPKNERPKAKRIRTYIPALF